MLRHINVHVQEDFEDWLLAHGFQKQRDIRSERDVHSRINEVLRRQRILAKVEALKTVDRDSEDFVDPIEVGKVHDKKRNFKNPLRPHQKVWNFEEEKEMTPHVLRPEADPMKCYEDGRIERLLDLVLMLAQSLNKF